MTCKEHYPRENGGDGDHGDDDHGDGDHGDVHDDHDGCVCEDDDQFHCSFHI